MSPKRYVQIPTVNTDARVLIFGNTVSADVIKSRLSQSGQRRTLVQ